MGDILYKWMIKWFLWRVPPLLPVPAQEHSSLMSESRGDGTATAEGKREGKGERGEGGGHPPRFVHQVVCSHGNQATDEKRQAQEEKSVQEQWKEEGGRKRFRPLQDPTSYTWKGLGCLGTEGV